MTASSKSSDPQDPRLEQVLADCLKRLDAGEVVDREALCRKHPDLAEELCVL